MNAIRSKLTLAAALLALHASWAWGATPTANDRSLSIAGAVRVNVSAGLIYTNVTYDHPRTVTVVTLPARGVLEFGQYVKVQAGVPFVAGTLWYTADAGYSGTDGFTWKISNGGETSNTATCTLNVTAGTPAAPALSVNALKDATTLIQVLPEGAKGYTLTAYKATATNLAGGSLSKTATGFSYTAKAGYAGGAWFQYTIGNGTATSATGTISILVKSDGMGKDWHNHRGDAFRGAHTFAALPAAMRLHWRRDYPAVTPAWANGYMSFDRGYRPAVTGQTVVVASNREDWAAGLDLETGAERWRFHAEGPIRSAPVAAYGRAYLASDDGFFYCLNAATGALAWKKRLGLGSRKVFGNLRVISTWPVRGGPVCHEGVLYVACGLWPWEGVFVYALDAATGAEIWRNDRAGAVPSGQPHGGALPAGLPPQGDLVLRKDTKRVFVPASRGWPGAFDTATGKMDLPWVQGDNRYDAMGSVFVNSDGKTVRQVGLSAFPVDVTAGGRKFTAADAAALGVVGTPYAMAAAGDKLIVATTQGSIYCFGAAGITPKTYPYSATALSPATDTWTAKAQQILSLATEKEGCFLVLGAGSGRLTEELLLQTSAQAFKPHVLVLDPDQAKVAALRTKLIKAGLYGARAAVLTGTVLDANLPRYCGNLIVAEDLSAAGAGSGSAFYNQIFRSLRPYRGTLCLPLSSSQHSGLTSWAGSLGDATVQVSRSGEFSLVKRTGLPEATQYVSGTNLSPDPLVRAPFGSLWYGDHFVWGMAKYWESVQPAVLDGKLIRNNGQSYDAYTGLRMSNGTFEGVTRASRQTPKSMRTGWLYGLREIRNYRKDYGCGYLVDYGNLITGRSASAAVYDKQGETGMIPIVGTRPGCNSDSQGPIPANGILNVGAGGCLCDYPLTPISSAFVHEPEAEMWAYVGNGRSQRTLEDRPLPRIGINFGAPGDRVAAGGTLWIDHIGGAGPSPDLHIRSLPGLVASHYHHSSRLLSGGKKWVSASGVSGLESVSVGLAWKAVARATASPPAVDGVLSDGCWNGASRVSLSNGSYKGEGWLRHDANRLYAGLSSAISGNWTLYLSATDRIRNGSAGDERGEGVEKYLRVTVSSSGVKTAATGGQGSKEDTTWAGAWEGKVGKTGGLYSAEFSIPWTTLEAEGFSRNNLLLNAQGPSGVCIRALEGNLDFWPGYGACRRFVPLFLDQAQGALAGMHAYTVRLYFAETEGAKAGGRVFDVKLQGKTVLSGFDIVEAAGGPDREVVREFSNVAVNDEVKLEFVAKQGLPQISGMELILSGAGGNQAPIARIAANPTSGTAPLDVAFDGSASSDADGSIASYAWSFGDGATATGATASHRYLAAGTYTARLTVTDDKGVTGSASMTIEAASSQTAPNAPTNLTATAVSSSRIDLAWTDNSSDEDGFKLERKAGSGGTWSQIATLGANVKSYANTGLSASTTYYYRVRAYNAAGHSAYSNEANATTQAAANATPVIESVPWADPNPVSLPNTTTVHVVASDPDEGPQALACTWSKVSGPGTVSFSPNGTGAASTATASFSAAGSYMLRVSVSDGAASVTGDVSVTVNTQSSGGGGEIVVDNRQAQLAGAWMSFSRLTYGSFYGDNYLWVKKVSGVTDAVTFTPNLPAAGRRAVYVYNVTRGLGAVNTRVIVTHSGGTFTKTISQKSGAPAGWVKIGEFDFAAGTTGRVRIDNSGVAAGAYSSADAVKFVGL